VPLVATAERAKSVINATVYSKSVLRVACEEISKARNEVVYFPSFEIVTGNYARGRYFAEDLRSVTEVGVAHVMKIFMKHFTEPNAGKSFFAKWRRREAAPLDVEEFKEVERALDLICEEELLNTRPSRKGWT
jgi:GSCFA family